MSIDVVRVSLTLLVIATPVISFDRYQRRPMNKRFIHYGTPMPENYLKLNDTLEVNECAKATRTLIPPLQNLAAQYPFVPATPDIHPTEETNPNVIRPVYKNGQDRALCPWTWQINYNPKRIPSHIHEAFCFENPRETLNIKCEPMIVTTEVIHLENNCHTVTIEKLPITIACIATSQILIRVEEPHTLVETGDLILELSKKTGS